MQKAVGGHLAFLCALLLVSSLPTQISAKYEDVIDNAADQASDALLNLNDAGRCHGLRGTVYLTTYLDSGVTLNTFNGAPDGKNLMAGPRLWHKKDKTNFANSAGDFCEGGDPVPAIMPPNSKTEWTIGESQMGIVEPELYFYFAVGDPVTGKETDCLLSMYQDTLFAPLHNDELVKVTLTKTDSCNNIPVMMNNLKIKQSGIFCNTMYDGFNGIGSEGKKVGDSEGYCASSRRLNEDNLVKTVYSTSFSVYWDPPINGSSTAAGFDFVTGPAAAPGEAPAAPDTPSSSFEKSHQQSNIATVFISIVAAVMLVF